ncbi:MAG: beta-ketoacyl synthase N-terminal-like domain-containing protein [Mycobacteriales bacterium]
MNDAIAVIGMGCRFPGGIDSPETYWKFLLDGVEAAGEVPAGRWEPYADAGPEYAAALRRTTRYGGFLADIDQFDADFFGVSPREAALMDPQQRIVLEVAWEALERAGIVPASLAGTDSGVFVGVNTDDYGRRLLEDLPRIEAWTGIGASLCAVANRVSYALDLRGPSMAVDTACSASLVAVHLACQSLRAGESPVAIAGGVMLMAAPGLTMVMDSAGALSADGRSKSFDAAADGYGRGEGCGIVVLKRLEDARRDDDPVLAVIRGSAVNQDGRTNGIMAPSEEAQAHLLRQAYRRAGLAPGAVQYVEAHGTGTRVGDPIEAGALAAVVGADRPADRPCLIGSVKSNIGHLEAASGVAGLIKTVLALRAGRIPPSLNFTDPNPDIPWDTAGLRVVTEPTPWPDTGGGPRRAGVSGYGYGGTLAHVVLEQAPETDPGDPERAPGGDEGASRVYPLSGASSTAAREYAARLAGWLAGPGADVPLADVGGTLAHRRQHLAHRATVVAADRDELVAGLRAFAAGDPADGGTAAATLPAATDPGLVWVFSGHGSQWAGMGAELLATDPDFAAVIDAVDPVYREEIGFSPREVLRAPELGGVDRIQPMIFAVQSALAAVWRAHGVRPAAVIGHSVGEIAAAVAAGILDLEAGARLVCRRSTLLRHPGVRGAMIMVNLPFAEVAARLAGRDGVAPAIVASPTSTVVAGTAGAVAALAEEWKAAGELIVRRVDSDVAFHSPLMDPIVADLAAVAADLPSGPPSVRTYSTALEDPRDPRRRDGAYWAANLRNPVRFAPAVSAALADGYRVFAEVSPHPVVLHSILETLAAEDIDDGFVAYTLRRNRPERRTLLVNLGALHCHGVPVDWHAAQPAGRLADLPTVAWQHREYRADAGPRRPGQVRQHDVDSHTLLGARLTVNGSSTVRCWQTFLDSSCRPYPNEHPVQGTEIIPAAVLLNTFFTAAAGEGTDAAFAGSAGPPVLSDVALRVPVSVTTPRELQVVQQDGTLRLSSRPVEAREGETGWLTHTLAVVSPVEPAEWVGDEVLPLPALRARCAEQLEPNFVEDRLAGVGVAAMGFFWKVAEIRRADGEMLVRVAADADGGEPTTWASVLDATLSAASVVFPGEPILRMPAHVRQVAVTGRCPAEAWVHVRVADRDTVDVRIAALDGTVRARFSGLRYGLLEGDASLLGAPADQRRIVYEIAWRPLGLAASTPDGDDPLRRVVLIGADTALAEAVAAAGVPAVALAEPADLDTLGPLDRGTAVLVGAASTGAPAATALAASWRLTRTAQLLSGVDDITAGPLLWSLTRGVREAVRDTAVGQAPLWGVGRVVAGELPDLWGGIVDLDDREPLAGVPSLLRVLRARLRGELDIDVVALRQGTELTARLAPLARAPVRGSADCRPDGTYLVTGGLGALGLEVAHWLARRGARRLVLAGRTGLPPREKWDSVTDAATLTRIDSVRALEAGGVTVRVLPLDVADRAAAAAALSPDALGLPPVRGIVHLAGVLDSRMVGGVDAESLATVLRPKADGALVLHELYPPGSLDFLVLFSSCGPLLGLPGQASYAAANAVLDALAHHRNASGHDDTLTVDWTSWRGLGMSTSSELIDAELAARGVADVTAPDAFRAWEYAERHDAPSVVVLRPIPLEPGARRPALLRELPTEKPAAPAATGGGDQRLAGLTGDKLREYLVGEVSRHVAGEMRLGPADLDIRRPLAEMGLDSVMTLVIRRRLEKRFRLSLPATLLWNRPTVQAISDYLTEVLSS